MKIGFLFPGQGAQYVGMGKELAQNFQIADELFNEANDILGVDLKKIIFEGPVSELTKTNNSQPGILVTSLAALAVARDEGLDIEPEAAAGLSLGEFTALHVAGVFSFPDVLKLVRMRGTFMQEACEETKGTMASIMGFEEETVREICAQAKKTDLVEVANVNCPGQVVVSGTLAGVKKAVELAQAKGTGRVVELNVAGAFHSYLMQSAREKLQAQLKEMKIEKPRFPVFFNVLGESVEDPEEIRTRLAEQVTSSVLWEKGIRGMLQLGVNSFIELGCGRVLVGLLKRIDRKVPFSNIEDCQSLEKTKKFVEDLKVKS